MLEQGIYIVISKNRPEITYKYIWLFFSVRSIWYIYLTISPIKSDATNSNNLEVY